MEKITNDYLKFKELTPEEKQQRGILGRLYGPIASVVKSTRNGRKYDEALWDKVFADDITKEMLAKGGIPGELDHPENREITDSQKIAIMMPTAPRKDKDGNLVGYFDILDTPCGRIAYALAKYGFKFGISSRGTGDVIEGYDGEEVVDNSTYDFQAFDLVLLPACENARLTMTEDLNKNQLNLKKALTEALDKATTSDKKIMKETLDNLNIKLDENEQKAKDLDREDDDIVATAVKSLVSSNDISDDLANRILDKIREYKKPAQNIQAKESIEQPKIDLTAEKREDIVESKSEIKPEAMNDGSAMIEDLQNSLKAKAELEVHVQTLQKQLAASNTMVESLKSNLTHYKNATINLSDLAKKAKNSGSEVAALKEALTKEKELTASQQTKLEEISRVKDSKSLALREDLARKSVSINTLTDTNKKLTENLEDYKTNSAIKEAEYKKKLAKATNLIEQYKGATEDVLNKYIQSKATMLGVKPQEIKNRLSESYTVEDIDSICEDLQAYNLNISKLPFSISRDAKVRVTESKNDNLHIESAFDDDVDESLIRLAGLEDS